MKRASGKKQKSPPSYTQNGTYVLDGVSVAYTVTYKSVKNYNLRVTKEGTLTISVPHGTGEARVQKLLCDHEIFLRKALQRTAQRADNPVHRSLKEQKIFDGTQLFVLGRKVCIRILEVGKDQLSSRKLGSLTVVDADLTPENQIWEIKINRGLDDAKKQDAIMNTVISEEIRRLQAFVNERLPDLAHSVLASAQMLRMISGEISKLPAKYLQVLPQLRYRDMKSRWGSCAVQKGFVTVNSRLCLSTEDCVEYLLCHELCHFVVSDHSKKFHTLLETAMPDAKKRKQKLNDF
jgi:predicted metal-dependent hydrolase